MPLIRRYTPENFRHYLPLGLCLLSVLVLLVLVQYVFIIKDFPPDQILYQFFQHHPVPIWMNAGVYFMTHMADADTVTYLSISLIILAVITRKCIWGSIFLALETTVAMFIDDYAKVFYGRARPPGAEKILSDFSYSFPSGHALISCSFYGFLFYLLATQLFPRHKKLMLALALGIIGLVGLSRIILGVHFLSDVLAGYSIAVPIVTLTAVAYEALISRIARNATGDKQ